MQATSSDTPLSFKRTCDKCEHLEVCTVVRAVAPLLGNWEEGHRPFEATDLAAICLKFLEMDPDAGNL